MRKKPLDQKIEYHEHDTPERANLPLTSDVASATECTGLMPTPPLTDSELESYQELSSMEIPKGGTAENSLAARLHRAVEAAQGPEQDKAKSGH